MTRLGAASMFAALSLWSGGALAQPYPDVVRESLYVPVRDGARLAMNVYRPADESGAVDARLPAIFVFTPYRARFFGPDGAVQETALGDSMALRSLLRAGYVVAVADIRGKGASFGSRFGFQSRQEALDGYDLVEWLAAQDYTTGDVGMIGCSYLGGTAFHVASVAPPALKAAFIGASDLDKYAFVANGGVTAQFNTRPDEEPEVDLASAPVDADADGALLRQAVAEHADNTSMAGLWYSMPYRDSVSPLTGNAFWEEAGVYHYLDAIRDADIATYFWGNWQDEPTAQILLGAKNLDGKLLAGPGGHCAPPAGFDFTGEVVRWFDHHLKGADNGIEEEPRATYWVEGLGGDGAYVRSDALPGEESTMRTWWLAADGGLTGAPAQTGADSFTTDYNLPAAEYFAFWPGPMGEHGLSWTSAPLDAALTLIGAPVAHVRLTASAPDAPLFVYLEQVAPGADEPEVLAFGRLRLSHRKLSDPPYDTMGLPWHSGLEADAAPLPPGGEATLDIALTPVSRVLPAGTRLRFVVAGADPRQRNLQDIRLDPAPTFDILRGGPDGARIDLPVAP